MQNAVCGSSDPKPSWYAVSAMTLSLPATFDVMDDMLWQAREERLLDHGAIAIERSGQIGPLVELALAMGALPAAYAGVETIPRFLNQIRDGFIDGKISGTAAQDRVGVFPLVRYNFDADANPLWDQWASHAENAAVASGLARGLAASLMGALVELQENVFQHSGRPETGLIAYASQPGAFEFVVADAGMGVLASLRQNPEFADVRNAGDALVAAASDGASRYARSTGHGFGIGRLFRALARDAGELRFRSDDHVLRVWGDAPSLTGQIKIAQKASLGGLIISVRCAHDRLKSGS